MEDTMALLKDIGLALHSLLPCSSGRHAYSAWTDKDKDDDTLDVHDEQGRVRDQTTHDPESESGADSETERRNERQTVPEKDVRVRVHSRTRGRAGAPAKRRRPSKAPVKSRVVIQIRDGSTTKGAMGAVHRAAMLVRRTDVSAALSAAACLVEHADDARELEALIFSRCRSDGDVSRQWMAVPVVVKEVIDDNNEYAVEEIHQEIGIMATVQSTLERCRPKDVNDPMSDAYYLNRNICRIVRGPRFADGRTRIVMSRLSGGTLSSRLDAFRRRTTTPEFRVKYWMLPLLRTVLALHRTCGLGHCDLKGNNICFVADTSSGSALGHTPVLIDLARARNVHQGELYEGEYLEDRRKLSYYPHAGGVLFAQEEDTHALGVILFEVLTCEVLGVRRDFARSFDSRYDDPSLTVFEREVMEVSRDCILGACTLERAHSRLARLLVSTDATGHQEQRTTFGEEEEGKGGNATVTQSMTRSRTYRSCLGCLHQW